MNEQQLREALRTIAHEEIPDTMNRWAVIQSKVRPRTPSGPLAWNLTRLAVVVAVLILALLTIAVGYAVFTHWGDPGMSSVEKAGLITPVQMTGAATMDATWPEFDEVVSTVIEMPDGPASTDVMPDGPASTDVVTPVGTAIATAQSGDVTATLDTIYADAQRIAVTFTVRNLPPVDPTSYDFMADISYTNGSLFNAASSQGYDAGPKPGSINMEATFDHHEPVPPDGKLAVVFTIHLGVPGTNQQYTFRFPVTLNVLKAVDFQVEQTKTTGNIAMTLKSVSITPSSTQLILCFDLPPWSYDWAPNTEVTLDGQKGSPLGWSSLVDKSGMVITSPRCLRMLFSTPYTPGAKHLTVTVIRLQKAMKEGPTQAVLDRAKERLAAQGIEVKFKPGDHGYGVTVIHAPEGMDRAAISQAVSDAMTEQVPGPWVFEVDIPQGP